jgi:hypothetical protein
VVPETRNRLTVSRIACFAGPLFHETSGSPGVCASASLRSVTEDITAAVVATSSIARRLALPAGSASGFATVRSPSLSAGTSGRSFYRGEEQCNNGKGRELAWLVRERHACCVRSPFPWGAFPAHAVTHRNYNETATP